LTGFVFVFSKNTFSIRSYGTSSSLSIGQQQQIIATPSDDPTRAAVENLIASIKTKQLQEAQRQSDRKILDIIHRVLGRTIDLVYDEDEQEKNQQELEKRKLIDEQSKISMIMEEEDLTITPRAPDVSRIDVESDDEKYHEEQEERDIYERDKTIDTIESIDRDEQIGMSRDPLYRHILLGISDEDLLNVRGTHINVPSSIITKNQSIPTKPIKHDEKSVHHFCIQMVDEKDMMPREIRAITQLYHQRARFRNQLPASATYYKHGQLPIFPIKESFDDEEEEQKM
jgi:hypothetical protein